MASGSIVRFRSAFAFIWPYQCTETESILMVYVTELKDWTRLQSSYVYFDWEYIWYSLTQECIGANVICQYSAAVKLSPFWFQVHFIFSYSSYLLSNSIINYYSLVIDMVFFIPTRLTGRAWGACQQGKDLLKQLQKRTSWSSTGSTSSSQLMATDLKYWSFKLWKRKNHVSEKVTMLFQANSCIVYCGSSVDATWCWPQIEYWTH